MTDWTLRIGSEIPQRWDWALGAPAVRKIAPIRTPRSTEKSKHIPVQAHCFVTKAMLKLESGLEYDLVFMLERDPQAAWMVPQPVRLGIKMPSGRRTVHTPDLLVLDAHDGVTMWNARPLERQDEKFLAQSHATEMACRGVGWRYQVFSGHSKVKKLWFPQDRGGLSYAASRSGAAVFS